MKKTRNRLLALALALMLSLSCMAMPAMAHGDEGIMPLYEVGMCPYCGVSGRVTRESYTHTYKTGCDEYPFSHKHTTHYYFIDFTECGHLGGGEYDVCEIG